MKSPLRYLSAFAFAASLLLSGAASAQTPVVTLDGLPAEPLIGESACFDAVFENTSGTIGYGPYLVVAYPPNLDVESVNFINQNASSELIGTFDATGVLTDPITGDPINGLENGQAFLYRYPIGAVAQSSPDFSLRICTKPSVAAELNAALPVSVTPGFEFGDTAEGTNGPVTTNAVIRNVTPVLARIKKTHSAPENERPPGPSHPFTYTVVVDVSDQATIDNVQLDDILSNKLQWTGTNASDITVTAANGTNCAVNTTPNVDSDSADKDVNNPGGTLTVTCDSLTGTAGPNDLSFSFEVFAVDILAEGVNNSQDIVNNEVTMNGNYDGAAIPPLSDNTDVTIRQSTMVKSVSGSNTPGSTDLVYTLNFRVSDYTGGASAYTLVDELPDGISYTASSTNITINGAAQTPPEPTVANNTPNAGQTRLTWNLRSIFGADLPAGAVGTISYAGSIDQYYAGDTEAVAANDTLTNNAETDYTLTEGGVSQNTSSASILIPPNTLRKSIIDPNPVPATFTPGQAVTFRLEMTIPAGSTDDVVITDFMPLPVIPVGSAVGAADSSITSVTIPTDPTFLQESSPGGDLLRDHMVVTVDASNNSVSVAFDNDIVVVTTQIIAVDIATVITSDPYADGLVLSNLMQMEYNNSNPVLSSELFTINIELDAPELNITAGVTAADNPAATFTPAVPADPSTELADSDVGNIDAADILTYTFTVENTGGSSAHNVLITSPVVAGLNCNDGSVTVVNGNGTNLGFSGNLSTGITLNDPLDGNDDNPVGGGAPFGSDTALVSVQCTVNSSADVSSTLTKTAEATWTATAASTETFPAVNDTADATLTSPSVEKSYSTIVPVGAAAAANIGEIVTYQLVVTVPEGEMPAARVVDTLPPGMAVVDVVSVTGSAGLSSSQGPISGIAATVSDIGAAAIDQGRRLTLDFGTLTNSNSNNAVAETITIEFRAQVLNVNTNVQGHALINSAALNWTPTGGNQQSASATSDPITVNEPTLTVSKSFSETTGDGGANFTGTIVITNTSGTDAYDVQLADLLAGDMHYSNISFAGNCGVHTDNYDGAATPESLDVSWDTFAAGDTCTITYDVSFDTNPVAGAVLTAPVDLQWHSIAGAPPATSPHNTFGVERTGNTANPGQSNDYRTNNSATFTVSGAAISKTLKSTDSTLTDGLAVTPAGGSALTVGESITFTITVTIPEVDVSNLVVSDTLPTTGMDFEITDTQVVRVGANGDITAATPNPTPVYSNSGGAANNDTVTLTFGAVTHNILDGTNTDDEIVIEIDAIVLDVTANANGNEADNSASVDFGGTAVATALYPMEVAEPILEISKSVNPNPATAGDTVTYTVTVSHDAASTMSASDVSVSDTLPAGLTLVNGSSGTGTCPSAPTSSSTTGNAFSASWNEFPLGASCELTYQATVNTNAVYGDNINNTAALKWHSLPDTFGDRREYNRSDTETLTVSEPGVNIVMVDSSNPDTPFVLGSDDNGITIGETATFDVTVTLPDGNVDDAVLQVLLPDIGVSVTPVSSQIISVGSDLTIGSGLGAGAAGSACTPPSPTCLAWDLGDVANANGPGPNTIVVRVVAMVNDNPDNTEADVGLPVVARLESQQSDGTPNAPLLDNTAFDIVVPELSIEKLTGNGTDVAQVAAADVHRFTLTVSNPAAESSATAQNVQVSDVLNADMLWVDNANVTSTCPGFAIAASPADGTTGTAQFTMTNLALNSNCTIAYDVRISNTVVSPGSYSNTATVSWDSTTGSGQNRARSATDSATLQTVNGAAITKTVHSTSVVSTDESQHTAGVTDATIGEEIEYFLTMTFDEGDTNNVELRDTLQDDAAGVLQYLSASVYSVGGNITVSSPTPVVAGNSVTFAFGDVSNTPDGLNDTNDQIVVRVTARVVNDPRNVDGDVLNNAAVLTFDGAPAGGISSSVDVDVVSPALNLSNDYSDFSDGTATVSLTLENTGTADAYQSVITETFDASIFDVNSITATTIPAGYELVVSEAGGIITVTLQTLGDETDPAQVLSPGETANFEFTIDLLPGASATSITSTADASATTLPGDDATAQANERTVTASDPANLGIPALSAAKTVVDDNGGNVEPGDVLTYTITVNNTGGGAATNVAISDTPATLSPLNIGSVTAAGGTVTSGNTPGDSDVAVTFASIANGGSASVSYKVTVASPFPDGEAAAQSLSNQANIDYKEGSAFISDDPDTGAAGDPTVVSVVADPVMHISKTDQVASANTGSTVVYLITYANNGTQDASGVVITETVPTNTTFNAASSTAGWSCAGTTPGSSCSFAVGDVAGGGANGTVEFAVTVDSTLPIGVVSTTNTVSITEDGKEFGQPDSVPSTHTATDNTPLYAAPSFVLNKTDGGVNAVPGGVLVYTLSYENNGSQDANGVELNETVPANTTFNAVASSAGWSCADASPAGTACTLTIGALAVGASGSAQFALRVDTPAVVGADQIANNASINDDGNSAAGLVSATASDTTPLNARPDLVITSTADTSTVEIGDTVVFTYTASLAGNQNTTGVVVTVTVPEGAEFDAANSSGAWSCGGTTAGSVCTATLGNMTVGDSTDLDFAVTVVAEPDSRRIDSVVSIDDAVGNTAETTMSNNTATTRVGFPSNTVPTLGFYQLLLLIGFITLLGARRRRV